MPLMLLAMAAFPLTYAASWQVYYSLPGSEARHSPPALFIFCLNFYVSDFMQVFNPPALVFIYSQLLASLVLRTPANPAQPIKLRLPFEGTWLVASGGATRGTSHSWGIIAQRYAYDFIVGASLRAPPSITGGRLEDYPCYGRSILAPVSGTAAAVKNNHRDAAHPGTGWLDWRATDPRGNYVLIEHQPGSFVLLAHLRRHSVTVRRGQAIQAGMKIAECGNSGRSTEPHLHLHCQRGSGLAFAVGLPIVFTDCQVEAAPAGQPGAGQTLERGMQVAGRVGGAG